MPITATVRQFSELSGPSLSMACMMIARRRASATRLSHRRSPGDRDSPVFELQRRLVPCQHDVRSLVQACANPPIAAPRDAAGIVDLA